MRGLKMPARTAVSSVIVRTSPESAFPTISAATMGLHRSRSGFGCGNHPVTSASAKTLGDGLHQGVLHRRRA
jgi:hypothetical protein